MNADIPDHSSVAIDFYRLMSIKADSISTLKFGRNNLLFKVHYGDGHIAVCKYNLRGKELFLAEVDGYAYFQKSIPENVGHVLACCTEKQLIILDFVYGENPKTLSQERIVELSQIIAKLIKHAKTNQINMRRFKPAQDAVFSVQSLLMQVNRRLALLQRLPQKYHALHDFLEKEVLTTRNSLSTTFNQGAATDVWEDLQFTHQIFSPSDFGAHNCLVRPNANIVLVDFEYSGRDDPAKLLADFLWHPGSGLSPEEQNLAIRVVSGDTEDSDRFLSRFARLYPLIGLNWVLILLNEFLPEKWAHRRIASSKSEDDWDEFTARQLHTAHHFMERVNASIQEGETS